MNLQSHRDRLNHDLQRFTEELRQARSDLERERLEATIRGTQMMLAAVNNKTASNIA